VELAEEPTYELADDDDEKSMMIYFSIKSNSSSF